MARYEVARQRDEYGGTNWGAGFFGWLVAIGLGALLTALVSAAGAAIAFSEVNSIDEAVSSSDETIGLVGAICLLAVALIAYFAGGYVAGRMSRFDGARQGVAVWGIGLLVTVAAVVLGGVFGTQYNILDRVALPRIPVPTDTLTTGGILTAIALVVGTLVAAILGGSVGRRYHHRVDRVALR